MTKSSKGESITDTVISLRIQDRTYRAGTKPNRPLRLILLTSLFLGIFVTLATRSHPKEPEGTYVGRQTCVSSGCHAEYKNFTYQGEDEFLKTMHAGSQQQPSPESLLIDRWFRSDTTLIYRDPRVKGSTGANLLLRLRYDESDRYVAQLLTTGAEADSTEWMKISYVFGGEGWLQRYLVEIEGSRYVLPFQYVLSHYRDRSSAGQIRFLDVESWLSYDSVADLLHLRKEYDQTFLSASWDNACVGCHISPFTLAEQETVQKTRQWIAEWPGSSGTDSAMRDVNASIGCESCHGPGSLHASDPTNSDYRHAISPKLWDPQQKSLEWTNRKLDLCAQCHTGVMSTEGKHPFPMEDGANLPFFPRTDLKEFIRDPTGDGQYWADGTTARAHHQTGQDYVRSKHYTKHIFSNGCYDCHNVHNNTAQPYMLNRDWYSLKKGEGCVSYGCHTGFSNTELQNGETYNIHTQHLEAHSQCVNCHYTKVASFGQTGQNEFSDHSDFVLRPSGTIELRDAAPGGMPNTCALSCHRNGYGDRNRPDAFFDVIPGDAMRAPDFGVTDTNLMLWNEPSDIELADSLWEGFKRLYPQFVSSVRTGERGNGITGITEVSPNPAHDNATIRFTLLRAEHIQLTVCDAQGRTIRIIADAQHEAGSYTDHWDCADESGRLLGSGVYFLRLTGETFRSVRGVVVSR